MLGTSNNVGAPGDSVNLAWSGADNTNHFFTSQDPFDPTKTGNFGANLILAGTQNLVTGTTNLDSYDEYTYYRMLAQLGTDSAPEHNKMNINYKNLDTNGNVVPGMETNLIAWTPQGFLHERGGPDVPTIEPERPE